MSKGILEFNLDDPTDLKAFTRATKATDAYLVLWEVAEELFRPARKHGYGDPMLDSLLEHAAAKEVVELLEARFFRILEDRGINLNDID